MKKSKKIHSVLIGDIVNFTKLAPAREKQLFKTLTHLLKPHLSEFYRGDSFQVYVKDPAGALRLALLCRASALSLTHGSKGVSYDVRISIGIGALSQPVKKLALAKGEAFLLSGRAFDELQKKEVRLRITTGNNLINTGLEILSDYINAIFSHMTPKQAEIISGLLTGQTQQDLADGLGKSKSTISQLAASGRWSEIEKLLQQFENLINYLS